MSPHQHHDDVGKVIVFTQLSALNLKRKEFSASKYGLLQTLMSEMLAAIMIIMLSIIVIK
jgi:hypothetical protein